VQLEAVNEKHKYEQVTACKETEPPAKGGNKAVATITAHRIIWTIPSKESSETSA